MEGRRSARCLVVGVGRSGAQGAGRREGSLVEHEPVAADRIHDLVVALGRLVAWSARRHSPRTARTPTASPNAHTRALDDTRRVGQSSCSRPSRAPGIRPGRHLGALRRSGGMSVLWSVARIALRSPWRRRLRQLRERAGWVDSVLIGSGGRGSTTAPGDSARVAARRDCRTARSVDRESTATKRTVLARRDLTLT